VERGWTVPAWRSLLNEQVAAGGLLMQPAAPAGCRWPLVSARSTRSAAQCVEPH